MATGEDRFRIDFDKGVARLTLTRPAIHNAFDAEMISGLTSAFRELGERSDVRIVVLSGEGRSFCAGADLNWMRSLAAASHSENLADAGRLEDLFRAVGDCPHPLVVVVNGPAMGGGCGLACCGDVVLAGPGALFGLTEVRLGILPAVIAPYVVRRIGFAACSRYMLTGERFGSDEAVRLGLVDEAVADDELESRLEAVLASLLKGGPQAQTATKQLLRDLERAPNSAAVARLTAEAIAQRRVSDEGQEGMGAFFDKRSPVWAPK